MNTLKKIGIKEIIMLTDDNVGTARRIIKQNIGFAIGIKLVALLLIFPGWLTLWIAVLSDTGAALIVTLNSMRLMRIKSA